MPFYRASFRHTFSTRDTVELTSRPYPANSWEHARQLADAFGYEDVRIAAKATMPMAVLPFTLCLPVLNDRALGISHNR
jgi:hypothetical protein